MQPKFDIHYSSPSGNGNWDCRSTVTMNRNLNVSGRSFCDVSKYPSGFKRGREFHGQLSEHQLVK